MTRKEELISLIENVKSDMIDLEYFCREFYRVYFTTEPDSDKLMQKEEKYMKELALMCNRYTSDSVVLNSFHTEKDMLTKIGAWGKTIN